jgi:WD40 repeat protein
MSSTITRTGATTTHGWVFWPALWAMAAMVLSLVEALQGTAAQPDGKEGRIYFWRDNRLASVQPDGKNLKWHSKEMVNSSGLPNVRLSAVRVSPDCQAAAFPMAGYGVNDGKTDTEARTRILKLDKQEPIIDLGCDAYGWAWSPDGAKLAFSLLELNENWKNGQASDLFHRFNWVIDVKTKKKSALRLPEGHTLIDWSPDGNWFLTESKAKTGCILSLAKGDGSEPRSLTGAGNPSGAQFSADGRMILFHGIDPKEKTKHVFAMDLKEKKPWKVSQELDGFVSGACWSPDGKRIAYVWGKTSDEKGDGMPEFFFRQTETFLIVADADGKNSVTLFSEKKPFFFVSLWSVDWR